MAGNGNTVIAIGGGLVAIVAVPGFVVFIGQRRWDRMGILLAAVCQVILFGILVKHSMHVGWFDFDWADEHLMGWSAMGIIPFAIGMMVSALSQPSSEH